MDRQAIIERVAQQRHDEVVENLNERGWRDIHPMWEKASNEDKSRKRAYIERVLEIAGLFELLEAAEKVVNDEYGSINTMNELDEAIKKAKGEGQGGGR